MDEPEPPRRVRGKADAPLYGSCEDACGKASSDGNCWCDASCVTFGDCCEDVADACAMCGDGVVGGEEVCELDLPQGDVLACPTACDDNDACTVDTLIGEECTSQCVHVPVASADGDGCCAPGDDASADSDCASAQFIGSAREVCSSTHSSPTLAASATGYAVGCAPLKQWANVAGTVALFDWSDTPTGTVATAPVNTYYYTSLQLSAHADRYQLIYPYSCSPETLAETPDGGWSCIEFRQFDQSGKTRGSRFFFGEPGNNSHPALGYSGEANPGANFFATWISYDELYGRNLPLLAMSTGQVFGGNKLLWSDPKKSDDRDASRTHIVWNGSSFGVFTRLQGRMNYGEVSATGTVVRPFVQIGGSFDYYGHTFGGQAQVVFHAGHYYLLSPRNRVDADSVSLQKISRYGKVIAEATIEHANARFPSMVQHGDLFYVFTANGEKELRITAINDAAQIVPERSSILPSDHSILWPNVTMTPDRNVLMAYLSGVYSDNDVYVRRIALRE